MVQCRFIILCFFMFVYMLSCFSHIQFFVTPWTGAGQAPCPCNSLSKNTGVGCHALFQGIFLTQRLNLCLLHLLHWHAGSLPLTSATWEAFFKCLFPLFFGRASLVAQMVKNMPAMQETWVQPLLQDSLQEGMAAHSSILAWRIPDWGTWWATVHEVAKSWTWLSD